MRSLNGRLSADALPCLPQDRLGYYFHPFVSRYFRLVYTYSLLGKVKPYQNLLYVLNLPLTQAEQSLYEHAMHLWD